MADNGEMGKSDGGNHSVFLIIQQLNLESQSPLRGGDDRPISIIRAQDRRADQEKR